ncbi:MAG: uroporphyrinogen decarboxylase [Parachlamydiaceae bacterium]|nr:uroporphyrinogen decarboxylase [Parachlamydiaceae bacterium]
MNQSRFLQALACSNHSHRPPIWMMRQAGRHLASYRELRSKHSFLEMCHNPDLISKVTLLPIENYDLDAAILFSDILVIPEAMGMNLRFEDQVGPLFESPIENNAMIESLASSENVNSLDYVAQGIKQVKSKLKIPLIGFCGAPFTVASYMIEGRSSRSLKKTKQWMFQNPEGFHSLLDKITEWSIAYLKLQINAGVNAVQIFDSWANYLAHHQFREFSLNYLKKILDGIKDTGIPTILFCKGSSVFAPQLSEINPSGIGIDWNCQLSQMRQIIPKNIALQGNLDPDILYAPLNKLESEVNRLLDEMQDEPGFIFNLGHGLLPDISEKAVHTLVECVKRREKCPATSLY